MKQVICAIDFGTTHSVIGYYDHFQNKPVLINQGRWATKENPFLLPSVVGYFGDHFEVGQVAIEADLNLDAAVYNLKSLIGNTFFYKFENYRGLTKEIDVVGLVSVIFSHLKNQAELALKPTLVKDLILSVPTHFNQGQIDLVVEAAKGAGWNVVKILFEPNCAAMFYHQVQTLNLQQSKSTLAKQNPHFKKVLIIDLGGATLDLILGTNYYDYFEPLVLGAKLTLGGNDFDLVIAKWINEQLLKRYQVEVAHNPFLKKQVLLKAKVIKELLSFHPQVDFKIKGIFDQNHNIFDADFHLTIDELLKLNQHLIDHFIEHIKNICQNKAQALDEIWLVGGQMKMPRLQYAIRDFFKKEVYLVQDPELVVIYGLCYWLKDYLKPNQSLIIKPMINLPIGIAINNEDFYILINHNSPLPIVKSHVFQTNRIDQDSVQLKIAQGYHHDISLNYLLASFLIKGLALIKGFKNRLRITIRINENYEIGCEVENMQNGFKQHLSMPKPRVASYLGSQTLAMQLENKVVKVSQQNKLINEINQLVMQLHNQIKDIQDAKLYLEITHNILNDLSLALHQSNYELLRKLKEPMTRQIRANQRWISHQFKID